MKLTHTQFMQLNDIVMCTRVARGTRAGERKDTLSSIEHFDMRSFNRLIHDKLVAVSEYQYDLWYATDLGYQVWASTKSKG